MIMDELIDKISAQTGQPATVVAPVLGALFAHLGDVLPAPLAHQLAIILGVHQVDGTPDATTAGAQPGMAGLLGGLENLASGSATADARVEGASALINAAQSLLGGFLASKR